MTGRYFLRIKTKAGWGAASEYPTYMDAMRAVCADADHPDLFTSMIPASDDVAAYAIYLPSRDGTRLTFLGGLARDYEELPREIEWPQARAA